MICNFTPVPRPNYRVGAPRGGYWRELLNSDATLYGGAGWGNGGGVSATPVPLHGRTHSLTLTLPALSVIFLKHSSHGVMNELIKFDAPPAGHPSTKA